MLLNFIFGEMRDGEIFTVLRTNGSSKSTLIDAFVNLIVWESRKFDSLEENLLQ